MMREWSDFWGRDFGSERGNMKSRVHRRTCIWGAAWLVI